MNDNDDLLLIGSLDQPLPIDKSQIDEMADKIDEKIKQSIQEKNPYIALNVAKQFIIAGQFVSWGLARIFYYLESNWHIFGINTDFDDFAYDYLGKHPHTVERYTKVEKMFAEGKVPAEFQEELRQKNIKDVIPIANAIDQGYKLDEEDWENVVDAPDFNTVARIIREDVKKKSPRKGALQLFLDKEGTIWAYQDNHRYFVGSLEISADEEPIKQAIERITKNSGMIKQ